MNEFFVSHDNYNAKCNAQIQLVTCKIACWSSIICHLNKQLHINNQSVNSSNMCIVACCLFNSCLDTFC